LEKKKRKQGGLKKNKKGGKMGKNASRKRGTNLTQNRRVRAETKRNGNWVYNVGVKRGQGNSMPHNIQPKRGGPHTDKGGLTNLHRTGGERRPKKMDAETGAGEKETREKLNKDSTKLRMVGEAEGGTNWVGPKEQNCWGKKKQI